ncbi:hypothetical protein [Bythopirellula goksoeyrii]|nr:hypothetical protein [Bythopirellula goksoeyrii]
MLVCVFAPVTVRSDTGLDFPSNGDAPRNAFVAFQWLNPNANGLPMWGPSNKGVTYIWKYRPRQQNGYYATMWYSRADGHFNEGIPLYDAYYGAHPYPYPPRGGTNNPSHVWELAGMQDGRDTLGTGRSDNDTMSRMLVTNVWYTQAIRINCNENGSKTAKFYIALPSVAKSAYIEYQSAADYGNSTPRNPAITFGDSPWYRDFQHERMSGVIRHIKIIAKSLAEVDILAEAQSEALVSADGQANIWYMNINPTPDDISDKSGAGHDPTWASSSRPRLYTDSRNTVTPNPLTK